MSAATHNFTVCLRFRGHLGMAIAPAFESVREARAWLALEGFRPLEGMLYDRVVDDRQVVVEIIDND